MGLFERLGYLLHWIALSATLKRWSAQDIETYRSRLKSPTLAEALRTLYGGGLPPAGTNGRAPARMLCRKHRKKFRTLP